MTVEFKLVHVPLRPSIMNRSPYHNESCKMWNYSLNMTMDLIYWLTLQPTWCSDQHLCQTSTYNDRFNLFKYPTVKYIVMGFLDTGCWLLYTKAFYKVFLLGFSIAYVGLYFYILCSVHSLSVEIWTSLIFIMYAVPWLWFWFLVGNGKLTKWFLSVGFHVHFHFLLHQFVSN